MTAAANDMLNTASGLLTTAENIAAEVMGQLGRSTLSFLN